MSTAAERAEIRKNQAIEDFRAVTATPEGRRFVWDLLAPAFTGSYTGEALSTAYNEGRRTVANELLARLNDHAPRALLAMLAASTEARAADDAAEAQERESAARA